jgi:hypothetical protein
MKASRRVLFGAFIVIAMSFVSCIANQGSNSGASAVGSSARDYLTSSNYTKLVVEIQSVSGFAPTSAAKTGLINFLTARLNKPSGVEVVESTIAAPGRSSYSIEDVRAVEAANRTRFANGATIVAYFLFLDGASASDSGSSKILGQAHGGSSMVMYEATIRTLSGGFGQPSRAVLEETILEHEFGHILGLVNTGTAPVANHQDTAHGAHCSANSCLMHWQVETGDAITNILSAGGNVLQLDQNCLDDLRANGGK